MVEWLIAHGVLMPVLLSGFPFSYAVIASLVGVLVIFLNHYRTPFSLSISLSLLLSHSANFCSLSLLVCLSVSLCQVTHGTPEIPVIRLPDLPDLSGSPTSACSLSHLKITHCT